MRSVRWLALGLSVALAAAMTAGCTGNVQLLPKLDKGTDLKPDEVLLVGRVYINPPLGPHDQMLEGKPALIPEGYRDMYESGGMTIGVTNQYMDLSDSENSQVWKTIDYSLVGKFGQTFYVRHPARATYLVFLQYLQKYTGTRVYWVQLPASFQIPIAAGDRVAYIGTLRYERNEYGDITSLTVQDNLANERAEIAKKVGKGIPISKRLAIPLDRQGKPTVAANIPGVKPPRAAAKKGAAKDAFPAGEQASSGAKFTPLSDDDSDSAGGSVKQAAAKK